MCQNRNILTGHAHTIGFLHVLQPVNDLALNYEVDPYLVLHALLYDEHLKRDYFLEDRIQKNICILNHRRKLRGVIS